MKASARVPDKALRFHGAKHPSLVVIGVPIRRIRALKETIIPLGVKEPFFIETRPLKLMVHIGCYHKVVFVPKKRKQLPVHCLRRLDVTVKINVARPPGPARLLIREGIKTAAVNIAYAEALRKVIEVALKALTTVCKARRSRESRARADDYALARSEHFCQRLKLRLPTPASANITLKTVDRAQAFLNALLIAVRLSLIKLLHSTPYLYPETH